MNDNQKRDDLEEADRLTTAAASLTGSLRDELMAEAAELRARWQPTQDQVVLAEVSAGTRESDLAEADKLSAVAASLRQGSQARAAVEAEASALRAKWPDFTDDAEGQVRRLGAYLLARGCMHEGMVPARAILDRLAKLEAEAQDQGPRSCHGCGLPQQQRSGPPPVNTFLMAAIKFFETDGNFREQVKSGQVKAGESTHPWIPTAAPHRGPQPGPSPWALAVLATMIKNDPHALAALGPQLRATFRDRGISIQEVAKQAEAPRLNGHASH